MNFSFATAFTILFLLGISSSSILPVHGHASPINYVPKPNEIVDSAEALPDRVSITFTENPEPRASSLKIINSNNERIDNNDFKVSELDKSVSISLDKSKVTPGVYTADWLVLSKSDGHITKGTYVFSVAENNTTTASQNQTTDDKQQQQPQILQANDVTSVYSRNITTDDNVILKFDIVPFKTGQNTFNLTTHYMNGTAVENIRNVFLEFNNPDKNLGPIVDTMNKTNVGNYSSTGAFLSQTGNWEVKITVQRIGEYDINQQFNFGIGK
ncbi:MAG: copper resistance protein CopC [Candidatus Nitrosocosmicus sp.]|nr:copper resistance protein CopC [Candidatus Nitrosocosmicus sp.]